MTKNYGKIFAFVISLGLLLVGCIGQTTVEVPAELQNIQEKDAIITVVNKLFLYTDEMNWEGLVNEVFTSEVSFDMTSVGGMASEVTSQSIVEGWEAGFEGVESVHHQIGNVDIELKGLTAKVFCYGTATQYKTSDSGKNTRTFIGTYNFDLTKENSQWKIDGLKFNLKMMDGNVEFK